MPTLFFILMTALSFSFLNANDTGIAAVASVKTDFQDNRASKEHAILTLNPLGFPLDEEIILSFKRPLLDDKKGEFVPSERFKIGDDGRIIKENKQIVDSLIISSAGYMPGERVGLLFQTTDKKFKHEMTLTPNPVVIYNKARGLSVRAELTSVNPTTYQLSLTGVPATSEVSIRCTGSADPYEKTFAYNEEEPIILTPGSQGRKGGVILTTIRAQNRGVLKVRLPWGSKLTNYQKGVLVYKP